MISERVLNWVVLLLVNTQHSETKKLSDLGDHGAQLRARAAQALRKLFLAEFNCGAAQLSHLLTHDLFGLMLGFVSYPLLLCADAHQGPTCLLPSLSLLPRFLCKYGNICMLENTLAYDVIIIALEPCCICCMRYRRVLHCLLALVLRLLLRWCASATRGGKQL